MSKKKAAAPAVKAHQYHVLQAPVITEKSTAASEHGKVVFKIAPTATKADVKAAVEGIFAVEVVKVNTLVTKGKKKVFRGRAGQRSDVKKAIVTLKEGQSIDFAAGVK